MISSTADSPTGVASQSATYPVIYAARETHSAFVVFVGTRVYKIKKPIRIGFLDFRTVDSRRQACEREFELNSRFAADVYHGVTELADPRGGVSEPVLVMDRLPDTRRLASLAHAGDDLRGAVADVARIVARVHSRSEHNERIDHEGSGEALLDRWSENIAETLSMADNPINVESMDEIGNLVDTFLAGRAALFQGRVAEGRIVDGHGDLLADDIFAMPDGVRILDCLDFDDRLRFVDSLDDACCLAMDLEFCGREDLAGLFLETFIALSKDNPPPSLVHHFIAYRAFVRAEVAAIRHAQGDVSASIEARAHAELAVAHLRSAEVTLTIIGGLPGSGKTTITSGIARILPAVVLSSDVVRKQLAGLDPMTNCPSDFCEGLYSPTTTERTYDVIVQRARDALEQGHSVIIDASWNAATLRERAQRVAEQTNSRLIELECHAPPSVSTSRIAGRGRNASDATVAVYHSMSQCRDSWPTAVVIDTGYLPETAVSEAVSAIRHPGMPHVVSA